MRSSVHNTFPTIYRMAMDYLPIQASAVPCARVFSSSSETDTKKCNRIKPVLFKALQILKFGIKSDWLSFTADVITPEEMMVGSHPVFKNRDLLARYLNSWILMTSCLYYALPTYSVYIILQCDLLIYCMFNLYKLELEESQFHATSWVHLSSTTTTTTMFTSCRLNCAGTMMMTNAHHHHTGMSPRIVFILFFCIVY